MSVETRQLINEISKLRDEIFKHEKLIRNTKKLLKIKRLQLYDTCNHEWIYDDWANFDDRCKYVCKICNCYRNRNWN